MRNQQIADVRFMHFRVPAYRIGGETQGIEARGGATFAYVERDGQFLGAVSYCNPKDNFQRVYGCNKAEGRLVQLLNNPDLGDDDKYFVGFVQDFDPEDPNQAKKEWLGDIYSHMTHGLGYV